jgi:hypothetical protein
MTEAESSYSTAFYTRTQFKVFRAIFGSYLIYHFSTLYSHADKLFTSTGMFPDPNIIPSWGIFPVFFNLEDKASIQYFILFMIILSLNIVRGPYRRISSLVLWYGWAYLFNRNVLIANPGLPYVGWLLLACAIIPDDTNPNKKWIMPSGVYYGAWFLMTLGYTISGIHKFQCPSWIDGSALYHVLSSVLGRDNFMVRFLLANPTILQGLTWGSLVLESCALPIGIFYNVRKWYWLMFIGMHAGIVSVVNFLDLTLGVMMIHFFTFDHRWLKEFPFNLFIKSNKHKGNKHK